LANKTTKYGEHSDPIVFSDVTFVYIKMFLTIKIQHPAAATLINRKNTTSQWSLKNK